uniref:ribosomal protein L5 n=1 Tax=Tsunamia transpacifica TaxID=1935457 RepID=UPI001BEFE2C4|nr:ribosomal protein L5 [Tsunamia transpacifica]QUE27862.1 ribosomal protein L5 [Tsunamia transpacifica]UNJ14378.1 ribosomal protein L5 [Tsunamia transpacifica]
MDIDKGLKEHYNSQIVPDLQETFQYKNIHEIPKLIKISINRGLGEASQNSKTLEKSIQELTIITGQKPIITKSKKAIAGFKIRENVPVGVSVTLRKDYMFAFLERIIHLVLPRIRDFRGISKKYFDGRGNYTFGLQDQLVFPEISYDEIDKMRGINISIITSAKTDQESFALLKKLGMPFSDGDKFTN